ncbi:BLUF domain-containing protein [Rubrivirga sp.]|uniref:BLUF domain-containing protein n=1 Tax=Rubrivirga sp. TaxID=1885344 RepID=UPI003C722B5B
MSVFATEPLAAFSYFSSPVVPMTDRDASDLLLAARRFNVQHHVTGKLVVLEDDGRIARFAQWIEGPPAALWMCIGRIMSDLRHDSFEVLHRGVVEHRRFPGWDMAFQLAAPEAFAAEARAVAVRT